MSNNTDVKDYRCLVSSQYSGIGGTDAIIKRFHDACQSRDFTEHCRDLGFVEAQFRPNPHLMDAGNGRRQKFSQSIASDSVELKNLGTLGVVFHGTHTSNIESILKDGLDMNKRSGQAYGPGEYFSMHPGTSISYCKGGLELLVFVVVLPRSSIREKNCPPDYVVVDNNCHHLPIGVLKFTSVDEEVMLTSNTRRETFIKLCKEVQMKSQIKDETEIKAAIIKKLIMSDIDSAANIYANKNLLLKELSRREVSWYVHQKLDKAVIPGFFTNLPYPMGLDEMEGVKLHNLDTVVKEEREAKDKLEIMKARNALTDAALGTKISGGGVMCGGVGRAGLPVGILTDRVGGEKSQSVVEERWHGQKKRWRIELRREAERKRRMEEAVVVKNAAVPTTVEQKS